MMVYSVDVLSLATHEQYQTKYKKNQRRWQKAIQIQNEKQTARDKIRWKTGRINRILYAMHTTEKNKRMKKMKAILRR